MGVYGLDGERVSRQVDRRRFLRGAAATAAFLASGPRMWGANGPESVMLVGTQTGSGSKGIYAYRWDPRAGSLRLMGLAAESPMPTYLVLSRDKRYLFAANETDTFAGQKSGGVSSFRVEAGGKLAAISSEVAEGTGTTNVGLGQGNRVLLCANYGGGSASSFPVSPDGRIGRVVSHFQYTGSGPDKARQEAPHVHRATASPGNGWALFNDLGLDVIHIYRMDPATAKLTEHQPWHAPAGSGPRSLRFHPNGRWAYCVLEMGSAVVVLDWDEAAGTLKTKQTVSLVPNGFKGRSQASETAIDRAGRFLYAADRYYNGLYSFQIDPATGELREMERTAITGEVPRYITLDPTERWLLAANQDSDTIEIVARDPKTGRLAARTSSVEQVKPQCLVFV